jgi:hypothetical protein
MEPNTESILALIGTSEVDYEKYATYHTLSNLRTLNPLLWRNVVGLAVDDLQSNYVFSGEEYPVDLMFETPDQEKGRKEIKSICKVSKPQT